MFFETIYHSTFLPALNRKEMMSALLKMQPHLKANDITGCTLICQDEVLHLLHGEGRSMLELDNFLKDLFKDFHLNRVIFEKMKKKDFQNWYVHCDHESECLEKFGKVVINEDEFRRIFIEERRGVFSPFSHMANAIIKRGKGVDASTADQLRPFW